MRDIWELLAEFKGHRIDEALIAHLIKHHCGTETPTTAEVETTEEETTEEEETEEEETEEGETEEEETEEETTEEEETEEGETDGCHNRWAILRSSDFFDNVRT